MLWATTMVEYLLTQDHLALRMNTVMLRCFHTPPAALVCNRSLSDENLQYFHFFSPFLMCKYQHSSYCICIYIVVVTGFSVLFYICIMSALSCLKYIKHDSENFAITIYSCIIFKSFPHRVILTLQRHWKPTTYFSEDFSSITGTCDAQMKQKSYLKNCKTWKIHD